MLAEENGCVACHAASRERLVGSGWGGHQPAVPAHPPSIESRDVRLGYLSRSVLPQSGWRLITVLSSVRRQCGNIRRWTALAAAGPEPTGLRNMESQKRNDIGAVFAALRRLAPFAGVRDPDRIYSVREANSALSAIVEAALRGNPQVIRKRHEERVLVIREETVMEMVQASASPRSFAEMFPVTETEPPLRPLEVRERPGREQIRL